MTALKDQAQLEKTFNEEKNVKLFTDPAINLLKNKTPKEMSVEEKDLLLEAICAKLGWIDSAKK